MLQVSLYAVPAPGQRLKGQDKFLGTVRTHMHKAPYTALMAGLADRLDARGIKSDIRVVDMQTNNIQSVKYGELDYCGRVLEKYRVGSPFEDARERIAADDVVGINANYTHSRLIASDFARYAKRINPKAVIVFGGTDATQDPGYYLRNGADIVVRGEAETTFEELLFQLDRGGDLSSIPSISFWRGNTVVHGRAMFLKQPYNVAAMPVPALGAVDLSTYSDTGEGRPPWELQGPFISVETSRGCAQACTFCATPATKGRFRFMSYDAVRTHFEYFKAMGVKVLLFQEDNVLSRAHRTPSGAYAYPEGRRELIAMFRLAREMGFTWEFTNGLEFGQYIHEGYIDYELIAAMFWHEERDGVHVGCYRATIPLENLSDDSSRLFRKLKPISESLQVIRALAETGVNTLTFNLIIGRPQDDEAVVRLSYERCQQVQEMVAATHANTECYFNVYNLSLFPGTIDFRKHSGRLAFDIERDPEVITFYLACMNTDYFSPLEMTEARGTLAAKLNGDKLIGEFDENYFMTHPRWERLLTERRIRQAQ